MDGYTRSLVRDGERTLIESRCDYCGSTIVGSVPQLQLDEETHRKACDRRIRQTPARR